ncbi:MAG: phosphate ABC transporter substrate-binding protein [Desulfobacterota bacterium]|nr:phosphate ABC transporter substrate-binding protein [Thermodesulfobacteriota bacterium]
MAVVTFMRVVGAAIICLLISAACGNQTSSQVVYRRHVVTIAGSTSVMPFTEKLAEHFMIEHPNFIINVQSGGSTAGIQACLNRTVDIGMSSRELKHEEKSLTEIIICYDGIAVIVNPENPIRALSLQQIRDIFAGVLTNWKALGWIDRRIDAVTREEGSGTRSAFEELVMHGAAIDDGIMVQDSNGSVKEVVATDPYAIGYVSLGMVDTRVVALHVDYVRPSVETILARQYKIVRPFLYLINGTPSGPAQQFITYVLSKDGQKILEREGLIPVYAKK